MSEPTKSKSKSKTDRSSSDNPKVSEKQPPESNAASVDASQVTVFSGALAENAIVKARVPIVEGIIPPAEEPTPLATNAPVDPPGESTGQPLPPLDSANPPKVDDPVKESLEIKNVSEPTGSGAKNSKKQSSDTTEGQPVQVDSDSTQSKSPKQSLDSPQNETPVQNDETSLPKDIGGDTINSSEIPDRYIPGFIIEKDSKIDSSGAPIDNTPTGSSPVSSLKKSLDAEDIPQKDIPANNEEVQPDAKKNSNQMEAETIVPSANSNDKDSKKLSSDAAADQPVASSPNKSLKVPSQDEERKPVNDKGEKKSSTEMKANTIALPLNAGDPVDSSSSKSPKQSLETEGATDSSQKATPVQNAEAQSSKETGGDKRNRGELKTVTIAPAIIFADEKDSDVNVMLPIQTFPSMSQTALEVQAPESFARKATIPMESEMVLTAIHREGAQSHIAGNPVKSTISEKKVSFKDQEIKNTKKAASAPAVQMSQVSIHTGRQEEMFDQDHKVIEDWDKITGINPTINAKKETQEQPSTSKTEKPQAEQQNAKRPEKPKEEMQTTSFSLPTQDDKTIKFQIQGGTNSHPNITTTTTTMGNSKNPPIKRTNSAPDVTANGPRRKSILDDLPQDVRTTVRIQLENIKIQLDIVKKELVEAADKIPKPK